MMPIFARDVLHGGAQLQGWLLSSFGIGSLLGALAAASIPRHHANARPAVVGAVVFSISLFFFASPNLSAYRRKRTKKGQPKTMTARFRRVPLIKLLYYCG